MVDEQNEADEGLDVRFAFSHGREERIAAVKRDIVRAIPAARGFLP